MKRLDRGTPFFGKNAPVSLPIMSAMKYRLAALAALCLIGTQPALAQWAPPGLNLSGSPAMSRAVEYPLDELTPVVLDEIFCVGCKGYRPRASHPVDLQDLNACPEAGGSSLDDLNRLGRAVSQSKGGITKVDVQADLNSVRMPYENNSNQLDAASRRGLEDLIRYLLNPSLRTTRVLIEGHANSTGSKASNYRLTCERAAAVRGVLRKQGIDADRLYVMGRGFDAPDTRFAATDGRQRRVTLRFLSP